MARLAIQLPARPDQAQFNLERWAEILDDPFFTKIEHHIETDRHGQVIMTPPPSFSHGQKGFRLAKLLETHLPGGEASLEVPISTSDGVRVADLAWLTEQQLVEARREQVLLKAPAICVEVLSPRNRDREMQEKIALSFDAGASEVWLCHEDGSLRFFSAPDEEVEQSRLAPDFPRTVEQT